jgi:hypothetical protein
LFRPEVGDTKTAFCGLCQGVRCHSSQSGGNKEMAAVELGHLAFPVLYNTSYLFHYFDPINKKAGLENILPGFKFAVLTLVVVAQFAAKRR